MCACCRFANPRRVLCDDIFSYFSCCVATWLSCLSRELKAQYWKSVASRTFVVEFAVRSCQTMMVMFKCQFYHFVLYILYIIKIYLKLKYLGKDIVASSLLAERLAIQDQYSLSRKP